MTPSTHGHEQRAGTGSSGGERRAWTVSPGIDPGRVFGVYHTVLRQPNWVVRAATLVFLTIIMVPIMMLLLLAVGAATVVFLVLAGINRLVRLFTGGNAGGRENVRIVRREHGPGQG